jgi:hypothetical protein
MFQLFKGEAAAVICCGSRESEAVRLAVRDLRTCLTTRLRASFTAFSPLAALLSLDVPPVRLHKSALPETKIR